MTGRWCCSQEKPPALETERWDLPALPMKGMALLRCRSQGSTGNPSGPPAARFPRSIKETWRVPGSFGPRQPNLACQVGVLFSFLCLSFCCLGLWCVLWLVENDLPLQMAKASFYYLLIPLCSSEASQKPWLSCFRNARRSMWAENHMRLRWSLGFLNFDLLWLYSARWQQAPKLLHWGVFWALSWGRSLFLQIGTQQASRPLPF